MPVRVGIGGWTYAPWRGSFYPEGLPQARELAHASEQLGAIEINATFYGSQKPASFARWRRETPDGFMFAVKASRFATHRRVLAESADAVNRFLGSGIAELGDKLGPLLWQFGPEKTFDEADFAAFLELLPDRLDGLRLRHALEVRHPSFMCEAYLRLARRHRAATVFTDSDLHPSFADLTGDFVYARLMRADAKRKAGYAPKAIASWAEVAREWASGRDPASLPHVAAPCGVSKRRDVFVFMINGAKERAPAAALALKRVLVAGK